MTDRAMTPQELREALQLAQGTFNQYQASGKFTSMELVPRLSRRNLRYSRKLVQAYLDREVPVRAVVFADKKAR